MRLNGRNVQEPPSIDQQEINKTLGEMFAESSGKRNYELVRDNYLRIHAELEKMNSDLAKYLANTLGLELKRSIETGEYKNLNLGVMNTLQKTQMKEETRKS